MYGIGSYIAVPLARRSGEPFGVLCALDPEPANLTEEVFEIFNLLAGLIAFELEADERQQRQAVEAEQARHEAALRDVFLSTVAHDLKNPLASINGYAALVQRMVQRGGPLPLDRLLTNLGHIQRSAARMTSSIDELMDLTRLQMDRALELDRESVDLAALVREVAAEQQQGTDRHRISVDGIASLVGSWDRMRIARVIQNLIGNAVRYSPDGDQISVTVEQQPGPVDTGQAGAWAVVRVADWGLGIPAADLPRIFEQFHRGAHVVDRGGGTGIGLFSVQQIVEQHGGQVAVESLEGQGSTFTVSLPV